MTETRSPDEPPINKISFVGGFLAGGLLQTTTELGILLFAKTPKFPDGIESVNFVEEMFEGGLPVVAGMYAGRLLHSWATGLGILDPSEVTEGDVMKVCGLASYATATLIVGPTIHATTGVHDVKWGPFR